ncbi:unnamed protein product [Sphagnum balticum]
MDSLLLQKQKLCPSASPISAASRKKETRDLELRRTPSSSSSSQAMELLLILHLRHRILENASSPILLLRLTRSRRTA